MTERNRNGTAFTCLRHMCTGVTPECCIMRQLARDRIADYRGGWLYHPRYPDCRGCEQGGEVAARHPGVLRRMRSKQSGAKEDIPVEDINDLDERGY